MSYHALYRAHRPQKFSDVVGQKHIVRTVQNALKHERLSHAYLFCGPRGTGKTSIAKIIAKAVNCINYPTAEPCNECVNCTTITNGSNADVFEIDAASNNGVDEIREIRDKVKYAPTMGRYKVYIIDEVHMLSTGAFNALLKTLEEPPKHVKFILATTEPQKIPATILSRCQRFDFKRVPNEDIIKRLKIVCEQSNIEISEQALNLIAVLSEGGMRDALSILERCNQDGEDKIDENKIRDLVGIPKITYIKQIVNGILDYDVTSTLEVIQNVLNDGKDLNNMLWEIMKYVKDILLYKSTGKTETYNHEEIEDIKMLSEKAEKQDFIDLICNLSELENKMKLSTQKLIVFQTGIIKLCNKISIENNSSTGNKNQSDPALEARVTKIENFLRAGNFVVAKKSETNKKVETNVKKEPDVPKYQGKTQDYWPNLVEDFKKNGKMFMHMLLEGTVAKEINDMTIAIEFPNGMNEVTKGFLENPINKQELKNMIHIASGKEMQIKFVDCKPKQTTNNANVFATFAQNMDIPFNMVD